MLIDFYIFSVLINCLRLIEKLVKNNELIIGFFL